MISLIKQVTGLCECHVLTTVVSSFVLQGIFEDTMYRLQGSGIYGKLAVDVLNAPAEIPLPRVRVNQEWNSPTKKTRHF
jgi:hypothetical protein